MKVKLLNSAGYRGMRNLDYGTIFDATPAEQVGQGITVLTVDLIKAGFKADYSEKEALFFSEIFEEYEVVEE